MVKGLRDRALIGVMVYTFARISAVLGMKVKDSRKLYDRRSDEISLDEVEKILI